MALVESLAHRRANSKTFVDAANPQQHVFVGSFAPVHYESIPDSGVYDTEVNMTPQRVNNAQFDGWAVTENGWHYALGASKTGVLGNADGVIGFGGRKGAHWFYFRLVRAGYLYVPTGTPALASNFTAIGGAPTYNRANLTSTVKQAQMGAATLNAENVAEWRNLWTTPGTGEVYARWRASGGGLKEEIVINAAARSWIAANAAPTTPVNQTFFGFVFQIDMSDVPKRKLNGLEKAVDADFNDATGAIGLHDAADRLLAFMPIDYVIVRQMVDTGRIQDGNGQPVIEPVETRVRLRKRFWRDADGNNYLAVGALASDIAAMPAGDLIFDPTFSGSIGSGTDDAIQNSLPYDDTSTTILVGGMGNAPLISPSGLGFRFTNVTIPKGATVSSAVLSLLKSSTQWQTVTNRWTAIDQDNTATFSSGSTPGSRPIVSAYIADESNNVNRTDATRYDFPVAGGGQTTLGSAINAVVNRTGWASGNALGIVNNSEQDASQYINFSRELYHTYDSSPSNAPQISITYTSPAATLEQEGFQWFNDDGSESASTAAASQDTNITVGSNVTMRPRFIINATGDKDPAHYKLQYKKTSDDTWMDVT